MASSAVLKEELTCAICLYIYTDPVTLGCGHSFCQECIGNVTVGGTPLSCPECRAEFKEFPLLKKNVSLQNITQQFLSDQLQAVAAGIFCTYCLQAPVPAVKSCLMCEASLCDDHLKVHSKSSEHVLTQPTTCNASRKCSIHEKVFMYYCTEDNSCVCVSCCLAGEHKGHQVESLSEATPILKEHWRKHLRNLTAKRQEIKRSLQTLQDLKTDVPKKADGIKENVASIFNDIRRQLDVLEKTISCELSSQEERVSLSVSDLIKRLEMKKEELSMEIHHTEEVYNMTDPIALLQAGRPSFPEVEIQSEHIDLIRSVEDFDEGLIAATFYKGLAKIVTGVRRRYYVPADPDILLNENTAASNLDISVDMKLVSCAECVTDYPETRERFQWHQVLSTWSISTGKHYWEVETGRTGNVRLGVAYTNTDRQGLSSYLGNNDKSWGLRRSKSSYLIYYNKVKAELLHKPSCYKLAIYLDYEAGQLSYYELSDPIKHLHTVRTTFTEPVHPGFLISDNCWLRILN